MLKRDCCDFGLLKKLVYAKVLKGFTKTWSADKWVIGINGDDID